MLVFKDKITLITGASSGLGAALAFALSQKGANVILVARRKEKLREISTEIKKSGGKAKIFSCDVNDYFAVKKTYQRIKKELGQVNIAFLNAGIGSNTFAQNMSVAEVKKIMNTNFFGVINWLEFLLKDMQIRNRGTVVVTSSLASYRGLPSSGSYSASKAALSSLIESYQIDLLATKIKLILVSPYFMITEMTGVNKKRNPFIWITAQKAAKTIIKGVEKEKVHIVFPWHFHFFMYILKIMPLSFYQLFWKIVKRGG